jgi:trimeric autotransporter adhesin
MKLLNLAKALPGLIALALFSGKSNAQIVTCNAFLQGNYIEVGVNSNGAFGSSVSAPAGYHPRGGATTSNPFCSTSGPTSNPLGFVADPAKDGWSVGTPNYIGDFFLPGTPFEGWAVSANGTDYRNWNASTSVMSGSITSYTNTGLRKSATWQGANSAGLAITQVTSLDTNAIFFTMNVTLTNTTSSTMTDVYYSRAVDPDQEQPITGQFSTINFISYQLPNTQNATLVSAIGTTYAQAYMGLGTTDCRAKCFINASGLTPAGTLAQQYAQTAGAQYSGTRTADVGVGLVFNLGSIAPGASVSLAYAYILDSSEITRLAAFTATAPNWAATGDSLSSRPSGDTAKVCQSTLTTVSIPSPGAFTWSWTSLSGETLSTTTGSSVNVTTGTTLIRMMAIGTPTSGGGSGCTPVSDTLFVNLMPDKSLPAAPTAGSNSPVCAGSALNLTATSSTTGLTYTWSGPDTYSSTMQNPTISSPATTASGVYTVYAYNRGCRSVSPGTTSVTVNAVPDAVSASGGGTFCGSATISATGGSGGTIFFQGTTSGGTSTATASSSEVVTSSGTYYFRSRSSAGCWGTQASVTVTINPVATISGSLSVCEGSTTTLTASIGGGSWFSGSTGVATVTSGVVTGVSAGTALISYYAGGCLSTVTVTVNAVPSITSEGSVYICPGATYTLTASLSGGTWGSSDAASATVGMTSGIVTGVATGSTSISYTLAGCVSEPFLVGVYPATEAPSAIEGPSSVCVGGSISLSSSTGSGSWSSSNPSVATVSGGLVSGVSGGTAAITYSVTGDCGTAYDVHIVTVISLPAPISGPSSVCIGSTITLTSSPAGGTWSTGGGAFSVDASTGEVTGVSAGTAFVSYTAPSGCSVSTVITVNDLPASITGTTSVCVGSTTTLSSATTGGSWNSSNTSRATVDASTGVVSGVSAGTASISYTLSTGCRRKTTVSVLATPSSITGSLSLCAGSTTTLSSATTGGSWSSSNAAAATIDASTGLVTGVGTGTTTIMYTVGGCSVSAVVAVSGTVSANTGNALICVGQSSTLSNVTAGGTWSSSNASVATVGASTGLVTAVSTGVANITYMASAGCFAITEVTINTAVADITGTTSVCPGLTTTLSNATSGGTWSSSNVAAATIGAGTGIVTGGSGGTSTISYIVSAGCSKSTVVTVLTSPGAITGTASMCVGLTTALSSSPSGGTWSSASPATASISGGGVVTGVIAGTATISYQNAAGCVSTRVVTVSASAGTIGGTLSTCIGTTTTLTAAGGGSWSSTNTLRATIGSATGMATGVSAGTVIISYALSASCVSTAVLTVTAVPSITGTALICAICTSTLTGTPSGGTWTSSVPARATIGASSGIVSGVSAGTTTMSYVAGGCLSTRIVTVNPSTSPSFGTPVVCVGQTNSTLSNPVPGGTWSSSNTSIVTVHAANGLLTGVGVGNANITYTTSPGSWTIVVATVGALVANNVGTTSICPSTTSALTNATAGGTWLSSNAIIATVGNTTGIVTGVTSGTASISYEVNVGCYRVSTVTVKAVPNIGGTATTVPIGGTRTLTGSPGGGTWSSANIAIATVSGTGVVGGVSVGGTTITYTNSAGFGGCFRTRPMTVTLTRPGGPVVGEAAQPGVLKIFPNPTSGSLTIDAPVAGTFTVYTIDGKEVAQYAVTASANMVTLPSNLAAGIYMSRFMGSDGTTTVVRLVYEQK